MMETWLLLVYLTLPNGATHSFESIWFSLPDCVDAGLMMQETFGNKNGSFICEREGY